MKTIYIEPNTFKCHVFNDGTLIAVETDEFDGKCDTFIEGYRFIPEGETWIREDGKVMNSEEAVILTCSKIKQLIGIPLGKDEHAKEAQR